MTPIDLSTLPAQYDHSAAQEKWYSFWDEKKYFHADPADSQGPDGKPPYSIVIPPPNVTGALHLGHALNNTLQDILCRMKRMQGFNVLWMPGTDHAGIATQAVVERRLLQEEGKSRHDLGREGLVGRIWEWKEQYEHRITGQLKQLGCSCDWERQRFTLDDQCASAVRETFFKLFADGKIYRGKRLVNWDPYLQTAVSDDEVFHDPVKGHFWHFKYPVIDPQPGEPTHVTIATTRPETMLGDTAVAVHPDPASHFNKLSTELRERLLAATSKEKGELEEQSEMLLERRQQVLPQLEKLRDMAERGVMLELPLTGRRIPLIADIWAKPELGSGCVKITPAHDANDYEVWQRNEQIGAINIMNPDGTLNDNVPEKYRGQAMLDARKVVVADMEEAGLLVEIEDREIDLAHSDRSKTPIEPYLADQWFVKMGEHERYYESSDSAIEDRFIKVAEMPDGSVRCVDPGLAQSAMDAVADGRVKITPERYAKGYLDWLGEKRDWPVGRQLWWGHRIPVWTKRFASKSEREAVEKEASKIHGASTEPDRSEFCQFYQEWDPDTFAGIAYFCLSKDDTALLSELEAAGYKQEDDVLDTWFSSALWPHSTMGWPEDTDLLKTFYPTNVLVTSRDIITLWVARMVLTGLYNKDEIPFPQVYIHPKILDGYGETMSKSKGNGVDPLDVIEKFGADALRFGIAYLTTETQDVRMPVEFVCPHCDAAVKQTKKNRVLPRVKCDKCNQEFSTQWAEKDEDKALPRGAVTSERFELGRNFANKLWNASRFALSNLQGYPSEPAALSRGDLKVEDRWLLSRLATVTQKVTDDLEVFKFADAARTLYDFAWNEFCSFYVEMTKARFAEEGADKLVAQRVLAHALDTLLRLLHPMMPFLTEEVWSLLNQAAPIRSLTLPAEAAAESVCIARWPSVAQNDIDATIEDQFATFQSVLGAVREVRQAQNVQWKENLDFTLRCDAATATLLEPMQPYFTQMANATFTAAGPEEDGADLAASKTIPGMEVFVDVSRFIDVEAEKARLVKERDNLAKFINGMEGKLKNKGFVDNAPAEVVEQQRAKLAETKAQLESVEKAIEKLGD